MRRPPRAGREAEGRREGRPMSESTTDRARPYPAALGTEIAELNIKMDSLIRHWADAAEMTSIMEACRTTITEASQTNHQILTKVHHQLNLLLTPLAEEAPNRVRQTLWAACILAGLLLSFWLGGFAPWVRQDTGQAETLRRRETFLADVHTTLEHTYSHLPKGVQEQLQDVYRTHKYEPLRAAPVEKKP